MTSKTPQEFSLMNSAEGADGHDVETSQNIEGEKPGQDRQRKKDKSKKPRYRASIACVACRDRRIRCVVIPGQNECTRCKNSGGDCIIRDDDERRRPISRAYMCSLTDRVTLLESMLKERGMDLPPANYPPKSRHAAQDRRDTSLNRVAAGMQTTNHDGHSPGSQSTMHEEHSDLGGYGANQVPQIKADSAGPPSIPPFTRKENMVSRLLSSQGYYSLDQLGHPLRFLGPIADFQPHSEHGGSSNHATQSSPRETSGASRVIAALSMETHDYLIELFWNHYNPVMHILHRGAFLEDHNKGSSQFYSQFLHVCVLAMGFRFSNKDRMDMKKVSLQRMESTLHQEAKQLLSHELEQPGGVPLVVALLLLGDLECGVGRDDVGWMYSGMAIRLAFNIGLHLDPRFSGVSEYEANIRRMTLRACIIYDRHWALLLRRPVSMKISDVETSHIYKQSHKFDTNQSTGSEVNLETMIHEALFDLMQLAGRITEISSLDSTIGQDKYLPMVTLDREFSSWYAKLPAQLCWTHENIATAPFPFFLLHQQYHSSLILLHRPFAQYVLREDGNIENDHFSRLSRTVCTRNAVKVAKIYWHHRQRFDTKSIFITGIHHAGVAAIALVAAIFSGNDFSGEDFNDQQSNMAYLDYLDAALKDMSQTYQPAEHVSSVLHDAMIELRSGGPSYDRSILAQPRSATVSARGNSEFEFESSNDESVSNRRHLESEGSQTRPNLRRKTSDTDIPLNLVTRNLARLNQRPQERSRGPSRTNSFLPTSATSTSEAPMSMSPAEFPHSPYMHPSAAQNVVDPSPAFEMWRESNMQMHANFEQQYTATPPHNMQFTNMVHNPRGGANISSVPMEDGVWDVRNQWYMRTEDAQQVEGLQGLMWEDGTGMNYNQGMGNPRM